MASPRQENQRYRKIQSCIEEGRDAAAVQMLSAIANRAALKLWAKNVCLLHIAARTGCHRCITLLLEQFKLPVNQPDESRRYPICLASRENQLAAMNALIAHGARVDLPKRVCGKELSPLENAVTQSAVEAVEMLLKASADPNTGESLSIAAQKGNLPLIEMLLQAGADGSRVRELQLWRNSELGDLYPPVLRHFPSLQSLYLGRIASDHIELMSLPRTLTKLNVTGNAVVTVPDHVSLLTSLDTLSIIDTHVTQLNHSLLRNMSLLRALWLTHNRLASLPKLPPNLSTLGINSNLFKALPSKIFRLRAISFADNPLVVLQHYPLQVFLPSLTDLALTVVKSLLPMSRLPFELLDRIHCETLLCDSTECINQYYIAERYAQVVVQRNVPIRYSYCSRTCLRVHLTHLEKDSK